MCTAIVLLIKHFVLNFSDVAVAVAVVVFLNSLFRTLGVQNEVLLSLSVFSKKRSTMGAFPVSVRVLSQKI